MALEVPELQAPVSDGPSAGGAVPFPVRKRRPARHLTAGVVVPVFLGLLAAALAYEALQSRSAMTDVVVARVPLQAGAPVSWRDTRLVKVHASDRAALQDLVGPAALREGWVVSVPVRAGEPLTASELEKRSPGPVLGQMSIAVPAQQAVGGSLAPGDFVDVIATDAGGGAYYVAQALRVVAVAPTSPAGGALLGTSSGYYVVVAVSKQTALRIAAALSAQGEGGSGLELVRSDGEARTTRTFYQGPGKVVP